jgi:hypothetical protein
MLQIKDAASRFLENSAQRGLDKRDLDIAAMLAEGKSCRQIGAHLNIRPDIALQVGRKIKDVVLREERTAKATERLESLIATLKASKKPIQKIPIQGLLIGRFEEPLNRAYVSTLGDAVAKGRAGLLSILGAAGVDAVEKILTRFGTKLPN